ncbi:MAG: type II toxin-antitoxin system RelE/ParE family toxin [Flavobacteriales bacterium]|nr:type II toxin-antitoxin system RelE/ParE family toxin [Flavobacteriales bacterium]
MVEVIWSVQARTDLDAIVDHIALDSPSRAEKFHWDAFAASGILEKHPKSGHPVPEVMDNSVREIPFGNYRVIYWLRSERAVVILTIRHGKRKLPKRLVTGRKRTNS